MARHPTRNRVLAGAFLLLMAVAAVAVLVLVGGWETWFTPQQRLLIHFDAAPNIKVGSPVLLAGHPVGRVVDVDLVEAPAPPERAPEGRAYVVQVTAELPKRYAIHQNARVTIQQALVGQSAMINIADVGFGKPATAPLRGHRTSPFADAVAQLGIGETEKQNLSTILANLSAVTKKVRDDLPAILEKLKTAGARLVEVGSKAKATLDRIDTVLEENRADLKATVANARALTAETREKLAKALDGLKQAVGKAEAILDENRDNLKATVANARAMSERGKSLFTKADEMVGTLRPKLKAASEHLTATLADFRIVAADAKALLATQKGNLAATAQNLRETSEHLRALSKEVRRAPWRLFAKPDKEEVESLNLYDTARAFALAATDLETASETLQVMLEAKQKGVAVDREMLEAIRKNLEETFTKYKEAEAALLKEFERIQKK